MACIPLILAVLVLSLTVAIFIAADYSAWKVRWNRFMVHDWRNELSIVRGTLDLEVETHGLDSRRITNVRDGLATMEAMLDRTEKPAKVWLRRVVRAVVNLVSCTHGNVLELNDARDPRIEVLPVELWRMLLNVLLNAVQARQAARSSDPVRVFLGDNSIQVSNEANERDRRMVLQRAGSTKGHGRGSGRGSIARSAKRLGWVVQYSVTECVVTVVLRWAADECYPERTEEAAADGQPCSNPWPPN